PGRSYQPAHRVRLRAIPGRGRDERPPVRPAATSAAGRPSTGGGVRLRAGMPLLRGPGAAGGAHRETGRPAAAGGRRPGQPGVTGADLATLRARLASLEARPAPRARTQTRSQPGLPPDCRWEETPHGQVALREEWV